MFFFLFLNKREEIKENERGLGLSVLSDSIALLEQKKRKSTVERVVRLGMMRHLNVIIDCSDSMMDQDLKPTRQICTLTVIPFAKYYTSTFTSNAFDECYENSVILNISAVE